MLDRTAEIDVRIANASPKNVKATRQYIRDFIWLHNATKAARTGTTADQLIRKGLD